MRGLTSYVKYEKSEEKTLPRADMNSYAEGNFKDDLLQWTHCKAGIQHRKWGRRYRLYSYVMEAYWAFVLLVTLHESSWTPLRATGKLTATQHRW